MIFIKHRMNRVRDLDQITSRQWGCEIDVRSDVHKPGRLLLSHDPWVQGEDFSDWLKAYAKLGQTGPLIVNTKEDGLEEAVVALLEKNHIVNFFFLDSTLPTLVKWTIGKKKRYFALRISAYESFDSSATLTATVDWLWVDCFERVPLAPDQIYKIPIPNKVLVSPELQGGNEKDRERFLTLAETCTHICTKDPMGWVQLLGVQS